MKYKGRCNSCDLLGGTIMKHKLTAYMLAGVLSLSLAVPVLAAETGAAGTGNTSGGQTDSVQEDKLPTAAQSVLYYGKVSEIRKDAQGTMTQLVMESEAYGDYIMNLSDQVVWIDSGNHAASDPSTLQEGEGIYVFHSSVSTQSLPPQSAALAIVRNIPQDITSAHYHVVEGVETQEDGSVRILTNQGELCLLVNQETGLSRYDDGTNFDPVQLKKGDRVMAWYEAVLTTYPAQAHTRHLMLLPAVSAQVEPETLQLPEGTKLTMELDGKVPNMVGRYEKGTAMVPVAAVAQALGFQVTYTPKGHTALVTVESDTFQVRLDIGNPTIYGVTKIPDAVGMTAPQNYGKAPYIVDPGTTWAPAELFKMLGKTVTLEGTNLIIR